ncbi:MAG: ferritin [Deltaproteobacteria bacterium]|nr:MAG: ferritin [Deltaproteobacteria bacterium]
MHRALVSLQEELEAVDWYQQRADATQSGPLRTILAHNLDEEIEHAAMVLEWLRRNHSGFAKHLKTYLFTEADITAIEAEDTGGGGGSASGSEARRPTIGALGARR